MDIYSKRLIMNYATRCQSRIALYGRSGTIGNTRNNIFVPFSHDWRSILQFPEAGGYACSIDELIDLTAGVRPPAL